MGTNIVTLRVTHQHTHVPVDNTSAHTHAGRGVTHQHTHVPEDNTQHTHTLGGNTSAHTRAGEQHKHTMPVYIYISTI